MTEFDRNLEIARYTESACHVMAVALHREFDLSFLLLTRTGDDYAPGIPAVNHVYARDAEGNVYDVLGRHREADVVAQWKDGLGASVRYVADEKKLGRFVGPGYDTPLFAYTEDDVEKALSTWRAFGHPDPETNAPNP